MLSKKLTFSLACLTMLIAIGLAGVLPTHAAVLGDKFSVTLSITDVSIDAGTQVEPQAQPDGSLDINIPIAFGKEVIFNDTTGVTDTRLNPDDIQVRIYGGESDLPLTLDTDYGVTLTRTDGTAFTAAVDTLISGLRLTITDLATVPLPGFPAGLPFAFRNGNVVYVEIGEGIIENANLSDTLQATTTDDTLGSNGRGVVSFAVAAADGGNPDALAIELNSQEGLPIGTAAPISGPFRVRVVLSEKPKTFNTSYINVTNATITSFIAGTNIVPADPTNPAAGPFLDLGDGLGPVSVVGLSTGRTPDLYQYLVNMTPTLTTGNDIVISVKSFEDTVIPSNTYDPAADTTELRLQVDTGSVTAVPDIFKPTTDQINAGPYLKVVPEKLVIPANGYLVLAVGAQDAGGIQHVSGKDAEKKTPAAKLYNVSYGFVLPYPANDLSNFFRNGGTLSLLHTNISGNTTGANADTGYDGAKDMMYSPGDVVINEIMWGLDRGLTSSQYIELHNRTSAEIGIDKNEWVFAVNAAPASLYTVMDIAGNSPYWPVPGADGATLGDTFGYEPSNLVSMSRIGRSGTDSAGWAASTLPTANINGRRIGTPGAANSAPVEAPEITPPTPVATAGDLRITEVMADSNGGNLPQWIEIANVSSGAVVLTGWSLSTASNTASLNLDIDDVGEVAPGHVILVVSDSSLGRHSEKGVPEDRVIDAGKRLLDETAFHISLIPPTGIGDAAGNLAEGWTLPVATIGRSSVVRTGDAGTAATSWMLSEQKRDSYVDTYYGHQNDIGTPGWHGSGGALPVELSLFIAKRDAVTGAVEIRWETQSETNNAGFYIKRSESRTGTFEAINPVMIPGAGTTSEKQSYTYADTTAKPNVVYYYQIADVSLDGDRQTLTQAHRLQGHLSAVGKASVIWGDLKSRE